MGEFFHGWRRKTGCVTLVLACLFMGGWVRNREHVEVLTVKFGDESFHSFMSTPIGFLYQWEPNSPIPGGSDRFQYFSHPAKHDDINKSVRRYGGFGADSKCQLDCCGFLISDPRFSHALTRAGISRVIWVIPHWSIAITLTLLSIWLLLSKPKKKIWVELCRLWRQAP